MTSCARGDLVRARQALAQAMQMAREYAMRGVRVEHKPGGGPVTDADRAVDRLLRETLPDGGDGWLSEESEDGPARLERRRVWVVDPIDGTRAFVAGRDDYSISIGLLVDRVPVLGAVGCPGRGLTVIGGLGFGVDIEAANGDGLDWRDAPPGLPRVLASRSEMRRGEWQRHEGRAALQPLGSVALQLALVAAGAADATWTRNPKHEWDVAAGAALVAAAGGEVWLPRGGHLLWNRARPRFFSFAAAAPGVRERVCDLVGPAG